MVNVILYKPIRVTFVMLALLCSYNSFAQSNPQPAKIAYFIDGYHGGVWGHFPDKYTAFMVDALTKNPAWKINLEIEPETWDHAKIKDSVAYNAFKKMYEDQSANGRIEIVNPSYAQSYLFNISGESIIRQFSYGIKKTKEHFPTAKFTTYSSEEPCFTGALPQILKSFGFKYASLKNPNTCWGGYTQAFGGELVNWIGPDGTKIPTSPRYAIENLKTTSTWETASNDNSNDFVNTAFKNGIEHPVGMCLQDAGWRYGPWLNYTRKYYTPTEYVIWRNYFENIAVKVPQQDWKFSQEDVLVSLVWGAQITQRIAQQVRVAENKITGAEKIATMGYVFNHSKYPNIAFDSAWRNLLLAQHHDCWIVPYNHHEGKSWAQHVTAWTGIADEKSDSVIHAFFKGDANNKIVYVKVVNTTASPRNEWVNITLPNGLNDENLVKVTDCKTNDVVPSEKTGASLLFKANVPSIGYNTYRIEAPTLYERDISWDIVQAQDNGVYKIETDLYKIMLDANHGGVIKSLIAKSLNNKEFVDQNNERSFNELRGYFYNNGGFHSSANNKAIVNIIKNGPCKAVIEINGTIAGVPFTQTLTIWKGERKIDCKVKINWTENIGIGEFSEKGIYKNESFKKAFYNDRYKLLALFPVNIQQQKVYKNAPFDVTESKLDNTFFSSWDSIKNNIIVNWVDVTDAQNNYGLALFTDHTTSYTHSSDFPLGLNLQYSGQGLFGPDYKIDGPTEINYAIVPHKGKWDKSSIWTESVQWNEPLIAGIVNTNDGKRENNKSLLAIKESGWEVTAITMEGRDMIVRVFNAENENGNCEISFACKANKAALVELNGDIKATLKPISQPGKTTYRFEVPKFGIRTIRLYNVQQ